MARGRAGQHPVGALTPARSMAAAALLAVISGCWSERPGSSHALLQESWEAYKQRYIQPGGNTIDPARNGETISEGQGYGLIRAALMKDKKTFLSLWRWTEEHLRRPDGLYSWRWSPERGGSVIDANTASDADQEIALGLIIGSHAFSDPALLARAREVVQAIRTHERVDMGGRWFPAAGNWAVSQRIVNLSYFVPYAYPYFARIDPEGRWDAVVDAGYDLVARSLSGGQLIPDFMSVGTDGSPLPLPPGSGVSGDFSSDALRIYWRVAVDCILNERVRACADPLRAEQITAMLARDGGLYTKYARDGSVLERVESTSFYGSLFPYLLQHSPAAAHAMRASKLSEAQMRDLMAASNRYYDANWVWFGIAAADGFVAAAMPPLESVTLSRRK